MKGGGKDHTKEVVIKRRSGRNISFHCSLFFSEVGPQPGPDLIIRKTRFMFRGNSELECCVNDGKLDNSMARGEGIIKEGNSGQKKGGIEKRTFSAPHAWSRESQGLLTYENTFRSDVSWVLEGGSETLADNKFILTAEGRGPSSPWLHWQPIHFFNFPFRWIAARLNIFWLIVRQYLPFGVAQCDEQRPLDFRISPQPPPSPLYILTVRSRECSAQRRVNAE